MKRILIIEDDPSIVQGLTIVLQQNHYQVAFERDGKAGLQRALNETFDLLLLDLMLPGINGEEICKTIRARGLALPIIMLTSKKEEADRVLGLEIGADDYVTKPFSIRELLARINALFRRIEGFSAAAKKIFIDDLEIDFQKMTVTKGGKPLKFTMRELKILQYLIDHEGQVVTRDQLLDAVWGYQVFPSTRTVDTFILNLRKKIEKDPSHPVHIVTVPTAGYRFMR